MQILATVFDWLLILAFLGFIGALCAIAVTALQLKNQAVSSYKRVSTRPIERVKMIATTGKGIVQQETVRAQRIGKSAKRAVDAVKVTVDEGRVAVESLRDSDIEPLIQNAQTAFRFASAAAAVIRAAGKQGAKP
jgi:hypothetical protein